MWSIARFGRSPLWLHHKIGNENTVNLAKFGFEHFWHLAPMINLTGHEWESLANHSGFQKSDTLAAKQKLVHVLEKGSMLSPYFI
jgi:hypothetical protein